MLPLLETMGTLQNKHITVNTYSEVCLICPILLHRFIRHSHQVFNTASANVKITDFIHWFSAFVSENAANEYK